MLRRGNTWMAVVLTACILVQSGCLAVAGTAALGGAAYAYHNGKATVWLSSDFADTWHAVKDALSDLGMPVTGEQRHRLAGTIESTTHTGTKVTLLLEEKPPQIGMNEHQTELGVRVGIFGDTAISQRILDQVRQRLAARLTSPSPVGPSPVPAPVGNPPPVPSQERIPAP